MDGDRTQQLLEELGTADPVSKMELEHSLYSSADLTQQMKLVLQYVEKEEDQLKKLKYIILQYLERNTGDGKENTDAAATKQPEYELNFKDIAALTNDFNAGTTRRLMDQLDCDTTVATDISAVDFPRSHANIPKSSNISDNLQRGSSPVDRETSQVLFEQLKLSAAFLVKLYSRLDPAFDAESYLSRFHEMSMGSSRFGVNVNDVVAAMASIYKALESASAIKKTRKPKTLQHQNV